MSNSGWWDLVEKVLFKPVQWFLFLAAYWNHQRSVKYNRTTIKQSPQKSLAPDGLTWNPQGWRSEVSPQESSHGIPRGHQPRDCERSDGERSSHSRQGGRVAGWQRPVPCAWLSDLWFEDALRSHTFALAFLELASSSFSFCWGHLASW